MFSAEQSIPLPRWMAGLNYERREDRILINRYFIHQGALLTTPDLSLRSMAKVIGYTENALAYAYTPTLRERGRISKRLARRIEEASGLPATILRPDYAEEVASSEDDDYL